MKDLISIPNYSISDYSIPGMMIETMAGKSAALHGLCHDCTPFTFSEDNSAIDHFGKLLLKGDQSLIIIHLLYHSKCTI